MTGNDWLQFAVYFGVLLALVRPLGDYVAGVLAGRDTREAMAWQVYAAAFLAFNCLGVAAVYGVLRLQGWLPWNPLHLPGVEPHTAWNIAVSFATNTNWQNYGGETTLSHGTQMVALTVQNFVSAASGIAVMAALARGVAARSVNALGNFWSDVYRVTLYVLLPLSAVLAVVLIGQGVVQNLDTTGPAASQVAIKQLGTNGGGFFNANSAHPFENPTPLSNFLEMLALLLLPAALCRTFGQMIGDKRQGWALLAVMVLILVPLTLVVVYAEANNMEGKEVRFGIVNSGIWAAATTAASNGSVNAMLDSFTPLGGLVPLFLMQLGEVIFGGVGSGVYGMVLFAVLAVFLAGLMVGRTR
jgi:K+-transporting ATPase ATPase A chain